MSPECLQQSRSRSGSCSHCSARSSCGSVAGAAAVHRCGAEQLCADGDGVTARVVMLGGPGVGKSAICSQLLTSDHVNTYEPSMVEDTVEKEVRL